MREVFRLGKMHNRQALNPFCYKIAHYHLRGRDLTAL